MSVLHVSIEHSNTVLTRAVKDVENGGGLDDNSATAKIYAISSVDGNVIYHVSDSTDQRKLKSQKAERRKVISNPVRAKRIFAVTTLVGGGKRESHYITEKNSYIKEHENGLLLHKPQVQNISVFVNPFSSTTTNRNISNDSVPEDDSTVFGDRKIVVPHECLGTATRFHHSKKGSEIGREEKPADILDSFSSKETDPDFSTFEAGLQNVKGTGDEYEEHDDGAESFCDSDVNSRLEVVNGVVHRWSAEEEDVLGELEESTTAEEFFGSGAFSSGDSSGVIVVQEILQDVLQMVVSQCTEGRQVSNVIIIMISYQSISTLHLYLEVLGRNLV
jgi:hypothetical protein